MGPDADLKRWLFKALEQQQLRLQSMIETQHMNLSEDLERKFSLIGQRFIAQPDPDGVYPSDSEGGSFFHEPASMPPPPIVLDMPPTASTRLANKKSGLVESITLEPQGACLHSARKLIENPMFDMAVGAIILLNTLSMFVQIQINGDTAAFELGLRQLPSQTVANSKLPFEVVEHIFCALFLAELVIRLALYGRTFFKDSFNIFDFVIVTATSLDLYILQTLFATQGGNLGMARLIRLFRVIRFLRVIRVAKRFSDLRILIKTLGASIHALMWSMVLVAIIILAGAICMAQFCSDYIMDAELDYDVRLWTFERYGRASSAMWTMFEITFSGGWPTHVRPLIQDVQPLLAIFWVFYIVVVYFAVIRIIAAMFLKEVMAISQSDKDMMAMEKMKFADKFADELRNFFLEADTSGDGLVSADEFDMILTNPDVVKSLGNLDLQVYEVQGLFNLLNDGDGTIPFEEFLSGAVRLKGAARSCDSVTIMHEQHKIRKELVGLVNLMHAAHPIAVGEMEQAAGNTKLMHRMVSALHTIG